MPGELPYVSVVVTARNDNHGGRFLERIQAFVNGWIAQSKRHRLASELIFVEWNPPAERPGLMDALVWPMDLGPCQVRVIQVPPDLHRRYASAETLPLYQMIAKNAGIRRARGRFVLSTNIDIIFSNELMSFLAKGELQPDRMYRIDRHDVMPEIPIEGIDDQLSYCGTHLIRINAREGTFNLTPENDRALSPSDVAALDSGIIFGPGWFPVEWTSAAEKFRWAATHAELKLTPPYDDARYLRLDIEPGPGAGQGPLEVLLTNKTGAQIARVTLSGRGRLRVPIEIFAGKAPFTLRSLVLNGGASIPIDTRILEFRVFQCDWERETQDELLNVVTVPPDIGEESVPSCVEVPRDREEQPVVRDLFLSPHEEPSEGPRAPVTCTTESPVNVDARQEPIINAVIAEEPRHMPSLGLWAWFQHSLAILASGDETIRVPVSPGMRRLLKAYVEHGGITGWLLGRSRHRTHTLAPLPGAIPVTESAQQEVVPIVTPVRPPADSTEQPVELIAAQSEAVPEPRTEIATIAPLTEVSSDPPRAELHLIAAPLPIENRTRRQQTHLHTNGCGDFTLMALENWLELRGYPEFDMFSMHLDSIFCLSAHHSGIFEEVLEEPMRIYHIEHGAGSGWTPEGQAKLLASLAERGLAMIGNAEVVGWARQMERLRCPMIFNRESWGLAQFELPEITVTSRLAQSV